MIDDVTTAATWPPLHDGSDMAAASRRQRHGRRSTTAATWPPLHDGSDMARLHWLEHPELRNTEIRLA